MVDYAAALTFGWSEFEWSVRETYESIIFNTGTKPTEAEVDAKWDELQSLEAYQSAKDSVDAALSDIVNIGILWAWNAGSTQYQIPLNSLNREFLTNLKIDLADGELNPYDDYLYFKGIKLLSPDSDPLPTDSVKEICLFCSLWVQKVSRIAITQKILIDAMDLPTVQAYNANSIDWTVTWVGHADWIDNLVLYNP